MQKLENRMNNKLSRIHIIPFKFKEAVLRSDEKGLRLPVPNVTFLSTCQLLPGLSLV